ncbi:HAD family hydrolase [Vibrio sp. ZSDZ65]|uniref:HAD family hydrolase n=1 Tax=Vibrio qingdaonensis TaxID=2829491 RepID=A0A9X3CLN7_9VIBR|nr:HAD family hydrolase [Vibrio qingdaonensis]MCW8345734.1 HAD family hydrolase [Vibrio qingdaonensis]
MSLYKLKAIVFDLDNTLISSDINFVQLRQHLNCPQDRDLLKHLEQFDRQEQNRLSNIIRECEIKDAVNSTLMPGAVELIRWLKQKRYYTGVVTRNCRQAAMTKITTHRLPIEHLLTREEFAPKPAPDALYHLMNQWQLAPQEILYVGDHYYDIATAQNAGCQSCFIANDNIEVGIPHEANFSFPSLKGLLEWLKAR